MWMVALIVIVAGLLQASLSPFITVAHGMPDLLLCAVVAIGLQRGSLVGAVAGAGGGFLVEMTSPSGTLGALALLYLAVGWGAGRFCGRDDMRGVVPPLLLCMVAELVVQIGDVIVQLLLDRPLEFGDVVRTLLASLILTGLIAIPTVGLTRRLLGAPRVVEPYAMSGDL